MNLKRLMMSIIIDPNNGNMKMIQNLLGHSLSASTMIYSSISENAK